MLVSDFDFELPAEQIAQQPPERRGSSRMLILSRATGRWRDGFFEELPDLLSPGDVLVLNQSRVIPARIFGQVKPAVSEVHEAESAGVLPAKIEILLTEPAGEWEWRALTRPARKAHVGAELEFLSPQGEAVLQAVVVEEGMRGERVLRFAAEKDFLSRLEQIGHTPLPPYIRRGDGPIDRERYQTVFAREPGSVAAPTAGLHFTEEILERMRVRGVEIHSLTLHVGLGTFQPVRVDEVDKIHLHSERFTLPEEAADAVRRALGEGRRVIAAGTTTVRTLEHCAERSAAAGRIEAQSGTTSIFLAPGSPFRVVSGMLTNFHLPRSTLLMLVSAFAGRENVLAAYRHAVDAGYRFFSYGDCMFIS